jgi:hypothetical protein
MWKVRCWNRWAHWSPSCWLKSKLVHLRGWMHVLHMVLGFLDFTCANYTLQIHVEEVVHSAWVKTSSQPLRLQQSLQQLLMLKCLSQTTPVFQQSLISYLNFMIRFHPDESALCSTFRICFTCISTKDVVDECYVQLLVWWTLQQDLHVQLPSENNIRLWQ